MHCCQGYCHVCYGPVCPTQLLNCLECPDCHRKCRSPKCFDQHKEDKQNIVTGRELSLCDLVKKCKSCGLCFYVSERACVGGVHQCIKSKCKICGELLKKGLNTNHNCYIRPLPMDNECPDLIFYDFEMFSHEKGEHILCLQKC